MRSNQQLAIQGLIVVLLLTLVSPVSRVNAQEMSFNVSPLLVELSGTAGGTYHFEIIVSNQSRRAAQFKAFPVSVKETPSGGYELFYEPQDAYSAQEWITVEPSEFTVPANRGARVIGTVQIPRGERGGRYAAVVLQLQPEQQRDEEARASSVFHYQIASLVELTIGSNFRKQAYISNIEVMSPQEDPFLAAQYGPNALWIKAALTNESEIHVAGKGRLIIRDEKTGRRVRDIPLGGGRGLVLPEATLEFSSIIPQGLPPGTYTLHAIINYGGFRPAEARRTITIEEDSLSAEGFDGDRPVLFTVDPEELVMTVPDGGRRIQTITVTNLDDEDIQVRASVQPLLHDLDGQLDTATMGELTGSIPWVQVSPEVVRLRPRQRSAIRVVVQNPSGEEPEGRYAYLTLTADRLGRERGEEPVTGGAISETGSRIVVMPPDRPESAAEVTALDISFDGENGFTMVDIELANMGKVHFRAVGQVILEQKHIPETIDGIEYEGEGIFEVVWQGALPIDALSMILPNEKRRLTGTITNPLPPGEYRVTAEFRYDGKSAFQTRTFALLPLGMEDGKEE